MQSTQSTARPSASAIFPSSSSSSSSSAAAAAVGHNRRAVFDSTPQPSNPHTFRGMVPGSVRQQTPQPSVCIHSIICLNLYSICWCAVIDKPMYFKCVKIACN